MKICKHYILNRNGCRDGDKCKFEHLDNVCRDYFKTGTCKRNDKCKFIHKYKLRNKRPKNTKSFKPSHERTDMRIIIGSVNSDKFNVEMQENDVVCVPPGLFKEEKEGDIYKALLEEINKCKKDGLWKMWHEGSHLIADDHLKWKEHCPVFNGILEVVKKYFDMDIKATRFNWYKDTKHWKPYHHDAAAIKPHIAKKQNLTVAISFGATREASFQHAKTKTTVAVPQPNGSIYTFGKQVNIDWMHGILQEAPEKQRDEGRISIIAWGWCKQT